MGRLTEETQIGPFARLKDKAEAKPGAFHDYDCLYAHMVAVTQLKAYEDTGLSPADIADLTARAEKAEAENRWIPVSERLPENDIDVLLYWSNDAQNEKHVDIERYHIDHWKTLDRPWIRAIAWMPLPEPPKGE